MIELVPNERLDILFDERCLVCNVHCPRDEANKVNCRILFKDGARAFEQEVGVAHVVEMDGYCMIGTAEHMTADCDLTQGALLVRHQEKEKP